MLKLKYLVENFELARHALANWTHDAQTLTDRMKYFRISSNAVYPFDRNGQLCFLRIAPESEKESIELLGEIDFLEYLGKCGYPAMRPIPSDSGELLLLLDTPWGKWYACAFEGVPGYPIEDIPMTNALANQYGETLGRLHSLSMRYNSPIRRRSEHDVLRWIRSVFDTYTVPAVMPAILDKTERLFAEIPRTHSRYGLIHYDFEPDNVFWDGEKCHVIDFEDGMMHFYAVDLVQALDELPKEYHAAFLHGYHTACPDSEAEDSTFPMMRLFRDLYAYARLLHTLSEKPAPEPDWLPALIVRLETRLNELESGILQHAEN